MGLRDDSRGTSSDEVRPWYPTGKSTIGSPIAALQRNDAFVARRRNPPNGRFWIVKSLAGAFAGSIQLCNPGSCISFKKRMYADPRYFLFGSKFFSSVCQH